MITQAAYPRLPPLLRLHNELLDFCDLLAPTRAELQDRQRVTKISADTVRERRKEGEGREEGMECLFLYTFLMDVVVRERALRLLRRARPLTDTHTPLTHPPFNR